jgi:ATP-binding protein involved in chromosome partitioning
MAQRTLGTIARAIVAVTSCKGGVGKSTISLELAFRLSARGHRVGLFDADVHGPSLPSQLDPAVGAGGVKLADGGFTVQPLKYDGVALMSFGWFSRLWGRHPRDDDVTLRGAAIGSLAASLLHTTAWGDLDFLIVDTPPGTGDIPQILATRVPLHGAVVVTTPSHLATSDVLRGVRMLHRCKVPILALIENLSGLRCDGCGKVHFPFGTARSEELLAAIGGAVVGGAPIPLFKLPIAPDVGVGSRTASSSLAAAPAGGADLAASLDALAAQLETACPVRGTPEVLPQGLGFHELPHWPTEMEVAKLGLMR